MTFVAIQESDNTLQTTTAACQTSSDENLMIYDSSSHEVTDKVHNRPVASCFGVVRPYDRGCEAADSIPTHSADFFFKF